VTAQVDVCIRCRGTGSLFVDELHFPYIATKPKGEACYFTAHVELNKKNSYLLSQRGNANETPLYFDMSSSCTVNDGAKYIIIQISGCKKMHVTVMLVVLANGSELPPL